MQGKLANHKRIKMKFVKIEKYLIYVSSVIVGSANPTMMVERSKYLKGKHVGTHGTFMVSKQKVKRIFVYTHNHKYVCILTYT